jgi:hypothetical protein
MIATILFSSIFYACGETEEQKPKEIKPVCDLNLDDLNNTSWLYGMATGGATSLPDSKLRLKFYTEDRKLKAHYNMGQATSMYTYDCVSKSNQILCSTIPDPIDVCLSFFAADKKCTRKSLEGFYRKTAGMTIDQKEMRSANIQAEDKIKDWKKKGVWDQRYRRLYNSIGKRQMGLLYAKVNTTACNLLITDNFAALANGEFVEDAASTVGTNAFLKHKSGELLWEGCTDTDNTVWTTNQAEVPEEGFTAKDVKKILFSGEDTHFWLFNEKLKEAEKDSQYSYKVWLNGQEIEEEKSIQVSEADKNKIDWHHVTKFDTPNNKGDYNLISFQIFKKPESGDKETVGIYCSKFQVANKTK